MPTLRLPDLPSKTDILIVGAGPTGLALAAPPQTSIIGGKALAKLAHGLLLAGVIDAGKPA